MNYYMKIVLLHLIILGSQAFYMYLSSKMQFKRKKYLYLIALPLVIALPVIFNALDPTAYHMYEYTVVIFMIIAAITDVSYAAAVGRDYMTDGTIRTFNYSYFIICLVSSFCGETGILIKAIIALCLAALIFWYCFRKKHSATELAKAIPFVLISFACAWVLVKYLLKL